MQHLFQLWRDPQSPILHSPSRNLQSQSRRAPGHIHTPSSWRHGIVTPTLAENHQNDSVLNFKVRRIDMLSLNTQVSPRTHLVTPDPPAMGPRALIMIGLEPFAGQPTILPREERTKEEKVMYKSMGTASRRPRTCENYLEGSDYKILNCSHVGHIGHARA